MTAVFEWANERIGFDGTLPTDEREALRLVRTAFPGFDEIARLMRELLVTGEGRPARLASLPTETTPAFEDPDGMRGEVVVVVSASLDGIHEPRPLANSDA